MARRLTSGITTRMICPEVNHAGLVAPIRLKRGTHRRLGDSLLADGLIDDDQLRRSLERQHHGGGFLGEILVNLGFVTPGQLKPYLEKVTGFGFVDLGELDIALEVSSKLPESYALAQKVLPFAEEKDRILVA